TTPPPSSPINPLSFSPSVLPSLHTSLSSLNHTPHQQPTPFHTSIEPYSHTPKVNAKASLLFQSTHKHHVHIYTARKDASSSPLSIHLHPLHSLSQSYMHPPTQGKRKHSLNLSTTSFLKYE